MEVEIGLERIVIDMLYSLQSIADNEVFLPNDEIWVYDLEQGVW